MAGQDRLPVFPSRANQVLIKQRVLAAQRGENLLKRKRDAIDMKLRELRHEIQDRKEVADDILRDAIFSFAKANFLNTDFNVMRVENSDHAEAFVVKRTQKVVGITLPQLELIIRSEMSYPLTGLSRGGGQVTHIRMYFQEVLKNLVSVASLDFALQVLTVASRQNNMRVNALNYVLIPRLQNTYTYIRNELEEFEREDFYRLKKSQTKQLNAKIAFSQLIKAKNKVDTTRITMTVLPAPDQVFDISKFEKTKPKIADRKSAREYALAHIRTSRMKKKLEKEKENERRVRNLISDNNTKGAGKVNTLTIDEHKSTRQDMDSDNVKRRDKGKGTSKDKEFASSNKKRTESANQTDLEADKSTQTNAKLIQTLKH